MTDTIYLDYNATAPTRPEIIDFIGQVMRDSGNASSVHNYGRAARKYVEDARKQVADFVNVKPTQVIFNSGATESNNTVLCGFRDHRVLISNIEHPAIIETAPHAERIPVTKDGIVDLDAFEKMLAKDPAPLLISVMLVNSETGAIQPISDIAKLAKEKGALIHTDAVQAAGRIPINLESLNVDFMSLSAHKMAGPQGAGALIVREGVEVPKFMCGGGQEQRQRAGTHNTAGIAGMGMAVQIAQENMAAYKKIEQLRDQLEEQVKKISDKAIIYAENSPRVGNTSNIGLPNVSAETQLMTLDLNGIAVSSGSACSSGSFKASHVLKAMGASDEEAKSAIRISLGWNTKQTDIDRFIEVWSKIAQK